jgi:hypothetical protein
MALLRDFLYGYGSSVKVPRELIVFNSNVVTESNGGSCCLFTVPGGVTSITGQMWGGGGGGAGSCFCTNGYPGAAGGYVEFSQVVEPGDLITVCAAGSTTKAANMTGMVDGFDSYICKSDSWCVFAGGGCRGFACAYFSCINGACCGLCQYSGMASASGATGISTTEGCRVHAIPGANSSRIVDRCAMWDMRQIIPSGYGVAPRLSAPHRQHRCGMMGLFPGGGGGTAHTCCNCCFCGGAGAGGAIYAIYE